MSKFIKWGTNCILFNCGFPHGMYTLPLSHLGDKLWWADQASEKMGTCNKKDGSEAVVLRNSTTLVMHMKIYDEIIQQQGECGGILKY